MAKRPPIGIIAEDDSDVEAIKILIKKIKANDKLSFKQFVGRGCGKLQRKCNDWSKQLKQKGCNTLILLHDLDRHNLQELRTLLNKVMQPLLIPKTMICIPVEEMEAWFLSDGACLKNTFNLKKMPKTPNRPETVNSPKEYLEKLIKKASDDAVVYLNTRHNAKIAANLPLETVQKKCPSFAELQTFIKAQIK